MLTAHQAAGNRAAKNKLASSVGVAANPVALGGDETSAHQVRGGLWGRGGISTTPLRLVP